MDGNGNFYEYLFNQLRREECKHDMQPEAALVALIEPVNHCLLLKSEQARPVCVNPPYQNCDTRNERSV